MCVRIGERCDCESDVDVVTANPVNLRISNCTRVAIAILPTELVVVNHEVNEIVHVRLINRGEELVEFVKKHDLNVVGLLTLDATHPSTAARSSARACVPLISVSHQPKSLPACAECGKAYHLGTRSQASAECAAVVLSLRTAGRSWSGRVERRSWSLLFSSDATHPSTAKRRRVVHGVTFIHHSILSILLAWLIMAEQMRLCVLPHSYTCSALLNYINPVQP